MKMTEFRSTQPLSDDDLATIRANVMASIAVRNGRSGLPLFMRFAIAAAIVLAIGAALFVRQRAEIPVVASRPAGDSPTRPDKANQTTRIASSTDGTTTSAARAERIVSSPGVADSTSVQPARAAVPRHSRIPIARAVYRPKHRPPQNPDYQTIRLEFRTPDPDVRIIWIANQNTQNTTTGGNS